MVSDSNLYINYMHVWKVPILTCYIIDLTRFDPSRSALVPVCKSGFVSVSETLKISVFI